MEFWKIHWRSHKNCLEVDIKSGWDDSATVNELISLFLNWLTILTTQTMEWILKLSENVRKIVVWLTVRTNIWSLYFYYHSFFHDHCLSYVWSKQTESTLNNIWIIEVSHFHTRSNFLCAFLIFNFRFFTFHHTYQLYTLIKKANFLIFIVLICLL